MKGSAAVAELWRGKKDDWGMAVSRPLMVDVFCGIGMGALGFVKAGFEVAAAVDNDHDACQVYRENLGVEPIEGDIRTITGTRILKEAGLRRGQVDLCVGCPPCQGFSTLRKTRKRKGQRDSRNSLLRVFGKRILEISPRAFVLENVSGLARRRSNRALLLEFARAMRKAHYKIEFGVLDAADFGVAQRRRRLIMLGSRARTPSLPETTHSRRGPKDGKLPWTSVRREIGDLGTLKPGTSDLHDPLHSADKSKGRTALIIRSIPHDGGSRKDLPRSLWLECHKRLDASRKPGAGSVYGRMRWSRPAPTITTRSNTPACGRFLHPDQDRTISLREAARLQSLPDSFRVKGTGGQVARWIGNGMPTNFAQSVGEAAMVMVRP